MSPPRRGAVVAGAAALSGTLLPGWVAFAAVSVVLIAIAVDAWQVRRPPQVTRAVPAILSRGVPVANAQVVGNEGRHLKLVLGQDGQTMDGIAFRMGPRLDEVGDWVDVVYALEVNEWNGERRLQLNIQDLRPAER